MKTKRVSQTSLLAVLVVLLLATSGQAEDWPAFRGKDGQGMTQASVPTEWSDTKNVLWKTELPGAGASSPIILDEVMYLTCYSGYGLSKEEPGNIENLQRHVLSLDRNSGKILWDIKISLEGKEAKYNGFITLHGYASHTIATDGKRLYVFLGHMGVYAYDLEGKQLWQTNVGSNIHIWGSAASPVLYKNLVIVNACVESDSLVALDKDTGKEVWRAPGMKLAWNTPLIVDVPGGKQELVVSVNKKIFGFDPDTGKQLWSCDGIQYGVSPSVVAADGIVYSTGGRKNHIFAVKAGGRGDVTKTHKLWENKFGSNVPSPVIYKEFLCWINQNGIAYCLNRNTGETVYKKRMQAGRVYASMVVAGDKLYSVSREKGTFVLAAGGEFKQLAQNVLASDESVFNASPAICDGQIFLRSDKAVYCIGNKAGGN